MQDEPSLWLFPNKHFSQAMGRCTAQWLKNWKEEPKSLPARSESRFGVGAYRGMEVCEYRREVITVMCNFTRRGMIP